MSASILSLCKTFIATIITTGLLLSTASAAPFTSEKIEADKTVTEVSKKVDKQKIHVNINTADKYQLMAALKGVGSKKAQAILEYRKINGNFSSIDQLLAVKGIGQKIIDKNSHRIMFSGDSSAALDKKAKNKMKKHLDKLEAKDKSEVKDAVKLQ